MRKLIWIPLLLLVACGDDDPVRSKPSDTDGPNALVGGWQASFEDMDLARHEQLLAPGFHFEFLGASSIDSGTPDGRWSRALVLEAMGFLLGGGSGKTEVASVDGVALTPLAPDWLSVEDGEFAGAQRRPYAFEATFHYEDTTQRTVSSVLDFVALESEGQIQLLHMEEWTLIDKTQAGRSAERWGPTLVQARNEYLDEVIVGRLEQAFNQLNFPLYDELRSADYRFEFAEADIAQSGTPDGIWSRAQDSVAIANMFGGVPGNGTAPVASFECQFHPTNEPWMLADEAEFEGLWRRSFALEATVTLASQDRFLVTGLQELHVRSGEGGPRLAYWRDQGLSLSKSVDEASLGAIKSRY